MLLSGLQKRVGRGEESCRLLLSRFIPSPGGPLHAVPFRTEHQPGPRPAPPRPAPPHPTPPHPRSALFARRRTGSPRIPAPAPLPIGRALMEACILCTDRAQLGLMLHRCDVAGQASYHLHQPHGSSTHGTVRRTAIDAQFCAKYRAARRVKHAHYSPRARCSVVTSPGPPGLPESEGATQGSAMPQADSACH